jgi:hypothetical protein
MQASQKNKQIKSAHHHKKNIEQQGRQFRLKQLVGKLALTERSVEKHPDHIAEIIGKSGSQYADEKYQQHQNIKNDILVFLGSLNFCSILGHQFHTRKSGLI